MTVEKKSGKTFSDHTGGGPSPGQTCKKPKDLSTCDREECGHGDSEGGGVSTVYT